MNQSIVNLCYLATCLALLLGCEPSDNPVRQVDEIPVTVVASSSYLAATTPACDLVIMATDPHAEAAQLIERYEQILPSCHACLYVSTVAQNGMSFDQLSVHLNQVLDTIQAKHPGAQKWALGFSGGATIAGALTASRHDIDGAILVGSPGALELTSRADFNTLYMAGWQDFNLMNSIEQTLRLTATLNATGFMTYDAGHKWPDALHMNMALLFAAKHGQLAPREIPVIGNEGHLPEAAVALNGLLYEGITSGNWQQYQTQSKQPLSEIRSQLAMERRDYGLLAQTISAGDTVNALKMFYRLNNLGAENEHAAHFVARATGLMSLLIYQRLVGLDTTHPGAEYEWWLNYYLLIDPNNAEGHFRKAIAMYDRSQSAAMESLRKAVDLGFADTSRLAQRWPGTREEWSNILP